MTIKLAVTKDDKPQESFEFTDDHPRVLVGRNEDCDVRLDSPGVSRHHCELVLEAGTFYRISDLGSSSGTFVNGRRVIEASLSSGDVVTVGTFQLAYTSDLPDPEPEKDRRAALGLPTLDAPIEAATSGQAVARTRAHLIVNEGGRNRTILLHATTFLIGSAANAQLRVGGWRAPRVAAMILRDRQVFRVWDTSKRGNAVWVNGKPTRDAELEHGDVIVVCDRQLNFYTGLPKLDTSSDVREQRSVLRQSGRQNLE